MPFAPESHSAAKPPAYDEFELSVFGPGVGECLVMHLGSGEWVIVDSCRYPKSRLPVAIEYLEHLGIEPTDVVRCILATHWHDDHIRGLADLVRRCPHAVFAMSAALSQAQFYQLVFEVDEQNKLVAASSSTSEFADILNQVETRATQPPSNASDGFMLYQGGFGGSVQMKALSPSPATVRDAQVDIVSRLSMSTKTRKLRRLGPNDLSVSLQVSTGNRDLLLKADLENSTDQLAGWNAVLSSLLRPQRRSDFVKIGHHGSDNADNDGVWRTMISSNSTSVVTPYSRLASPLPRDDDVKRLKNRNTILYATTWPPSAKPPRRRGVDGFVESATRVRHALNRSPGFVRIRFSLSSPQEPHAVETFDSAVEL